MNAIKYFHKFFLIIIFLTCQGLSQNNPGTSPCSLSEANQFDFWLGKWKAKWITSEGTEGEGENIVSKILEGCVIEENFNGKPVIPLNGKSFSVYVSREKKWKQTWVDNNGGYLNFSGEFNNGRMVLRGEGINHKSERVHQRMIFYNITKDSFDWNWERSSDGEIWELLWKIHYSRIE